MPSVLSLGSRLPLVAAPMAGGVTTVALASAGAFPFLAAGYKSADAMADEVEAMQRLDHPFGINLFVPGQEPIDRDAFAAYAAELADDAAVYGIELDSEPIADDDHWSEKLAFLIEHPVPVISLTFGLPERAEISALQQAGGLVLATVTSPDEGREAANLGVDGLIVQGPGAGGHSGTHHPERPLLPLDTASLTRQVIESTGLPVIAAGGVDGPDAVRDLLAAGASAVAVGTLLLRTDESGASATYKHALADPAFRETVMTRAFTGRPARALRNAFTDRHSQTAPLAYPAIHHLTRSMRQAAAAAGNPDGVHLWAGTGFRQAEAGPVADVIAHLATGI